MGAGCVSALAVVRFDPLRDSRHPHAAAAREQADWLSWFELGGATPISVYHYQWATDRLLALYPDVEFAGFTDSHLLHVIKTFPPASRPQIAVRYRSWFRWGVKTRRLDLNPMDLLPDFKPVPQKILDVFTEAEESSLTSLPHPDGGLMTILFEAGLRRAEARQLTVRRVDLDQLQVNVIEGAKGGKQRVVPITAKLAAAFAQLITLEGLGRADHFWATKPGGGRLRRDRPIGDASFWSWWQRCVTDAKVTYRKPHASRHTYATRWRQRGLALDDIQALLGHSSIQTTSDLYVHTKVIEIAGRMRELEG